MREAKSPADRPGPRVRVREDYVLPEFRGKIGIIEEEFLHPQKPVNDLHSALGVRLEDGRYELFWQHEVEAA